MSGSPAGVGTEGERRRDRKGGEAAGRVWPGLTKACFIALVVLPEGHEPDGDGLQEWPDGGRELWRDAAGSPAAQEGLEAGRSEGQRRGLGGDVVIQQTFSGLLLCARHCSRRQEVNKGVCSMLRNASRPVL